MEHFERTVEIKEATQTPMYTPIMLSWEWWMATVDASPALPRWEQCTVFAVKVKRPCNAEAQTHQSLTAIIVADNLLLYFT